jgi:hypothetical protein
MKKWLYVINNFSHDFFTGLWFGSVALMFMVHHKFGQLLQNNQDTGGILHDSLQMLFGIGGFSLLFVLFTGVMRFLYRHEWDTMENAVESKKKILVIKHIVLGTTFMAGSIYAYFLL